MDQIIHSGETGYLVSSGAPAALAEGIELLIPQIRNGFLSRAAIRNSVIEFSWEQVAAAMAEEYAGAIRGTHLRFMPDAASSLPAYGA